MFFILLLSLTGTLAYIPQSEKDNFAEAILRQLIGFNKDPSDLSYFGFPEGRLSLDGRSLGKDLEEEQQLFPVDYDEPFQPSLRDQEFLEHSSLWGSHLMSGGAGEGKQRLRPAGSVKNRLEVKTDGTLPSYCNPPNPCPLGYTAEQGCLEDFENTASFSRNYQFSQDCMCDSEHMFDCPNPAQRISDDMMDTINDLEFNRFLQHTMQEDPALQHKSLVAKKFNINGEGPKVNPFLTGERLPVAAKKGHLVVN